MEKKRNNLYFNKNVLFMGLLVIILLILVGFYFKGVTGNVALNTYSGTNYSAPYNLSNSEDLVFKISSDSLVAVDDMVNLSVNVSINGYIYQKGYVFNQRTHSWEVFNFNQTPVTNSYWIKDFASKDLIINVSNRVVNQSETYVVAYACQKDLNDKWQCGCQSESETNCKRWMLHKFDITNITNSPEIRCTDDANCTMTHGTCDTLNGVCVSGAFCIPNCSCNATTVIGETCPDTCGGLCQGTKQAGSGTIGDPYQIISWTQMNNTRNDLTASYILMKNLTASDLDYVGIGNNWQPIGDCGGDVCGIGNPDHKFVGNFNGNNNLVFNLSITILSCNATGLFGYSSGNISNIGLLDVHISNGDTYVGGLVGRQEGGSIFNSYTSGIITGRLYTGGLIGYLSGTQVNSSYSRAKIIGSYSEAGGLVGASSAGVFNNV